MYNRRVAMKAVERDERKHEESEGDGRGREMTKKMRGGWG
jgi:hypothetical protein